MNALSEWLTPEAQARRDRRYRWMIGLFVMSAVLLFGTMFFVLRWANAEDHRLLAERRAGLMRDCVLHEGNTAGDCNTWINQ